jgi:hypothetical protein
VQSAGAGAEGDFGLDFISGGGGERRKPKPADSAEIVNYRGCPVFVFGGSVKLRRFEFPMCRAFFFALMQGIL